MFLLILKIAVLLAVIIIPLRPKRRVKESARLIIDSDTSEANYAINENGTLEKIQKHSLTDN